MLKTRGKRQSKKTLQTREHLAPPPIPLCGTPVLSSAPVIVEPESEHEQEHEHEITSGYRIGSKAT